VRGLPRVRNRVVILGTEAKGKINRSWSISFCAALHDAHRPLVQMRRLLAPAEVAAVSREIHPPVAPPAAPSF